MQSVKKKICIIKLDGIGDVLRTTPILRRFQDCEVTWVTQEASLPLLKGNPFINKTDAISQGLDILGCAFDELYNFDEDKNACMLAMDIKAKNKKGFAFINGVYYPFDPDSRYAYDLSRNDDLKFKLNKKTYQQIIFEMAGMSWEGEDYVLGYKPNNKIKYSVGINYLVGQKFPNKAWPRWQELSGMLESFSVQRRFETLKEYIDWINSCRIIVTGDSLGMHLALALKKKVIVLMGPTSRNEIETYGRAVILTSQLQCSPCYKKNKCDIAPSCMDLISPQEVYSEIKKIEEVECFKSPC